MEVTIGHGYIDIVALEVQCFRIRIGAVTLLESHFAIPDRKVFGASQVYAAGAVGIVARTVAENFATAHFTPLDGHDRKPAVKALRRFTVRDVHFLAAADSQHHLHIVPGTATYGDIPVTGRILRLKENTCQLHIVHMYVFHRDVTVFLAVGYIEAQPVLVERPEVEIADCQAIGIIDQHQHPNILCRMGNFGPVARSVR